MRDAERIRNYARERYLLPARKRGEQRFSIRAGDIVRELGLNGRTPAVCSALRSRRFWQHNDLRLVEVSGPKSGQSTTVVYTYEFANRNPNSSNEDDDAWARLRGSLKEVFSELGGGESYLHDERTHFYPSKEHE